MCVPRKLSGSPPHPLPYISGTIAPRYYYSKGVHPKFVQELLGYATISITLDRYSHVIPAMGDQMKKEWKTCSPKPSRLSS
jgi:hypothetical protein